LILNYKTDKVGFGDKLKGNGAFISGDYSPATIYQKAGGDDQSGDDQQ